jgi:glucose/arabinose dehydrogenase
VGTGDAGNGDAAQDPSSLAGKILRITGDGRPAAGNPFDSPVYSYGHRNVQGLAWDAGGQLYATEFGQNRYDELNRIEAGGNYGWPRVEGFGDDPKYLNPVGTWSTSDASPSGLAILEGRAYLACLRGTKLYRIGLDASRPQQLLSDAYGRLRSATVAPDGTLWLTTSNRDGRGDPIAEDDRIVRLLPDRLPD